MSKPIRAHSSEHSDPELDSGLADEGDAVESTISDVRESSDRANDSQVTETAVLSECERTARIDWLIDQFQALVFRYAVRLAGNQSDAEDLTQQTFLTAQEKIEQLRDPERGRSWLLTICRNRFLKNCRKRQPVNESAIELMIDEIPESAADALPIDEEILTRSIAELPDDYRLVLLMFYFEEKSYREIAEALDIRLGTVMSRLSRAKGRLRQSLLTLSAWESSNASSTSEHAD